MTASDAESISMRDLLAMATPAEREEFEGMSLGYTETYGAPDLRETIATTYRRQAASDILCFAGASEGIFAANNVILNADSHAIVVTPNYQSHETLPVAICEATGVPLDPDDGWSLDIDRVRDGIKSNTKLVTINFPHNPTGTILPLDRYMALVELCRTHGIYILHDEISTVWGRQEPSTCRSLPMSMSAGCLECDVKVLWAPWMRIGWIACQDAELISRMERMKHYLSICNSGPSERLTKIALNNREHLLASQLRYR